MGYKAIPDEELLLGFEYKSSTDMLKSSQEKPIHIGELIRDLRLEKGSSIYGLAHQLKIDPKMLWDVETGKRGTTFAFTQNAATSLGITGEMMFQLARLPSKERIEKYQRVSQKPLFWLDVAMGELMKDVRENANVSKKFLSHRIDITPDYIKRVEGGKALISSGFVYLFANYFNCSHRLLAATASRYKEDPLRELTIRSISEKCADRL